MIARRYMLRLARDCRGAAIIEFAILVPTLFALMIGVIQVGVSMWNYNAVRAIMADTMRYTVVEYQKQNRVTTTQIQSRAVAIAVNSPYRFNINNFNVTATTPTSDITGMIKYSVAMTYSPPNFLGFAGIQAPSLSITRPIYVPS